MIPSTLFYASTEKLVNSHPGVACALFTPRWVTLPIFLYLFYLATLKLIIAWKPYWVMEQNHERAALLLNISVIVLTLVDNGLAFLIKGTTCITSLATMHLLLAAGIEVNENTFLISPSSPYMPATLVILFLSVTEYAIAEIIVNLSTLQNLLSRFKLWGTRCSTFFNRNNQIDVENIVLDVNYSAEQPPTTQFQKMMILIKGMGFFSGLVFLNTTVYLIFADNFSFVVLALQRTGVKLLLQCIPVYWVLVVDDVHELTKRRVTPFLTSVYQYLTDNKECERNKGRKGTVTPLEPQGNELQRQDDILIAGSSRDNRPQAKATGKLQLEEGPPSNENELFNIKGERESPGELQLEEDPIKAGPSTDSIYVNESLNFKAKNESPVELQLEEYPIKARPSTDSTEVNEVFNLKAECESPVELQLEKDPLKAGPSTESTEVNELFNLKAERESPGELR